MAEDQPGRPPEPPADQASIGRLIRLAAHKLLPRASEGVWVTEQDITDEPALALAGVLYDLEQRGISVDLPEIRALDEALADADPSRAYRLRDIIALRNRLRPPPQRPLAVPDLVIRPITRREAIAVGRLIQRAQATGRIDSEAAESELTDQARRAGLTTEVLLAEIGKSPKGSGRPLD